MIEWVKQNIGTASWGKVIEKDGSEIRLSATLAFFWKDGEPLPYLVVNWNAVVNTQTPTSSRSTTEAGTIIGRDIAVISQEAWAKHIAPTIEACERRVREANVYG